MKGKEIEFKDAGEMENFEAAEEAKVPFTVFTGIEIKDGVMDLRVNLTNAEKQETGEKIARELEERQKEEGNLKYISTEIKSRIQAHDARINELANKLRAGYEIRPVSVQHIYDYDHVTVTTVREDNQDQIKVRAITKEEMQMRLPLPVAPVPEEE